VEASQGRVVAFATAKSYARCHASLRPSAPTVPPHAGRVATADSWGARRWPVGGGVECGLISENFRGLFENKFERGEWTAGCISRKFKDFYAK